MQTKRKKRLIILLLIAIPVYIGICTYVYFNQEKFLFQYYKINTNIEYKINVPFEETNFRTDSGVLINGLYFKQKNAKGIVIINRGSGGSLENYSPKQSVFYNDLNYDVFIYDYRGNGKSQGNSENMESLFHDLRFIYKHFSQIYGEENIVLLGDSFGTGIAAKIASENNPKHLILMAPYYKYNELLRRRSGWMPLGLIVKYNFKTFEYLEKCSCPVLLIHGEQDDAIKPKASERLYKHINSEKHLLIIKNAGHSNLSKYPEYNKTIKSLLE
ncbi:MAG: alpha/beta fold hydrolase [Bacteroidales bacterium]